MSRHSEIRYCGDSCYCWLGICLLLLLCTFIPITQQSGAGAAFHSSNKYDFPEKENQSIYVKLVEFLQDDYQTLAMPVCVSNHHDAEEEAAASTAPPPPMTVTVDMWLFRLFGLDGPTQALTIDTYIEMSWRDCALQWEPKNFSDITQITLPADDIWRPDIINYQSLHGNYEEGLFIFGTARARVRNNGQVQLGGQLIHRSFCRLDMNDFPFDTQTCNITFSSWNKDASIFRLTKRAGGVHDDKGHALKEASNGEWDIVSFTSFNSLSSYRVGADEQEERPYSEVTFQLKLQRKPTYVQMYLIFPCFILYWLASITFILPVECGEKISLCITVLLSQIVFLLLLAENVPRTASSLPILGLFYFLSILLVLLCILCTTLVLNVGYKPSAIVMPDCLNALVRQTLLRRICFNHLLGKDSDDDETSPANASDEESYNGWRLMAAMMDRMFFLIYVTMAIALSAYIFSYF